MVPLAPTALFPESAWRHLNEKPFINVQWLYKLQWPQGSPRGTNTLIEPVM